MDDGGHHENGRLKAKQYKTIQGQRNLALSEKKAAMAKRDMAFFQRDSGIAERNNAIMERDNAIAALQYRENSIASGTMSSCPPGCQISRGVKHMHRQQQSANHMRDDIPMAPVASDAAKSRRGKRSKDAKILPANKKASKSPQKVKKEDEDLDNIMFNKSHEWKNEHNSSGGRDDLNKHSMASKSDGKGQELGLNQIAYDESTIAAPVCSCTGQSLCCTTTLSMYSLPAVSNKRHTRVGGRKMSGSAFNKLLSRLAVEGHDLLHPVDLKEHWAKHGANHYITIK
ncbi:hypothetical protein K2173_027788 [Erythroxylum novogranatense]|uniref:GAGA-binding transcriptional activator n=1 Tax=Erythroxylum novogranatense TaxID=1862640 RepID=A0AAV8U031_9ROSI|nr:hypothetical protein K2173_027788 [Erythroxylum novogranatense]